MRPAGLEHSLGSLLKGGDLFMRFIKYICILSFCFPTLVFSGESVDSCSVSFSSHKEFIKSFFSDSNNIKQYQGQVGYIRFVEEHLVFLKMNTVFNYTSRVLSKEDMDILNWQKYHGSTKEFREERFQILDETGNVKKEYQGPKGYVRYSDEFYIGDMKKAYENVSTVLSESEKRSLNWQQYKGNTKEFRKERSQILDEKGNVKKEYQGLIGYARYADEFYIGDMKKAYINVSAVFSESEKKNLNWQAYQGNTKEFREERFQILDETGNVKKEYQGPFGYVRYSDEFYIGDMKKAYENVSAVLSESEKRSLNWQQYHGNTKEFRKERSQILDEKGNVKKEYQGLIGYARYADAFYGGERKESGNMKKAYINVSAVFSESEKKNLNWQSYQGSTKEFREERFQILDETGNVKKEYQGPKGYVRYSDEFYIGDMKKAYENVSTVLSKEDMQYLGWKQFKGDTSQFHSLFEFFNNHSFEDYKGPLGQKKIANTIFKNHLRNTYTNISALRDHLFIHKDEFRDLRESGWSPTLSW